MIEPRRARRPEGVRVHAREGMLLPQRSSVAEMPPDIRLGELPQTERKYNGGQQEHAHNRKGENAAEPVPSGTIGTRGRRFLSPSRVILSVIASHHF